MVILNNPSLPKDPDIVLINQAVSAGIRHIGIATYSSGKVKAFLVNKGYSEFVAEDAVAELVRSGYINDEKASGRILRYRTGTKQESSAFIYNRLLDAGIAEDVASKICQELPSDRDTCLCLYKALGIMEDTDPVREEYLKQAFKRGYSYEIASSVFDSLED